MKITRKDFLRLSGLSFLSGAAIEAGRALAGRGSSASVSTVPQDAQSVRWGMVVDLRRCQKAKGCTVCTDACDAIHNVPRLPDPKHQIKWIWTEPYEAVFPYIQNGYAEQTDSGIPVPLMCNHCASPPCVHVCPTQATWRRADGIVMMDWHRCIGCRYCMAACPYGSRSFNWVDPRPGISKLNPDFPTRTKGVVEKCNFCDERLAIGQIPACVEACPEKALVFGNLADPNSEPRKMLRERFAVQREPELGTGPSVYYLV